MQCFTTVSFQQRGNVIYWVIPDLTWSHQPLRPLRERWWERWSVRPWDHPCLTHRSSSSSPAGRHDSNKGLKHAHLSNGCKVEIALILTALYIFFQSSAVSLRLSLCMRIVKDTAHSEVFINVLPMLHMKENGALMCVDMWTKTQI